MDNAIHPNDLLAMAAAIIQTDLRPRSHKAVNKRLQRAVKSGRVQKEDVCARCGKPGYTEAHHWDYSQPLLVEWLCKECHKTTHVLIRAPMLAEKRSRLTATKCSSEREERARIYRGDFQVVRKD